MANLIVPFTYVTMPANGYRLLYRPKGSSQPYTIHSNNFFTSPAEVAGLVAQDYEGFLQGDCGGGQMGVQISFSTNTYACPGIADINIGSSLNTITLVSVNFPFAPGAAQNMTLKLVNKNTQQLMGTLALVVNPDGTLLSPVPAQFTALMQDTVFTAQLSNDCSPSQVFSKDIATTGTVPTIWVADSVVCEQEEAFTLAQEYAGFSSPSAILYDQPTGKVWVGDADDAAGNVYSFDPATFASTADITRAAGFPTGIYYAALADAKYRRLYFAGQNSGGLKVFDLATGTTSTIAYGTDGVAFNRVTVNVTETKIYAQDSKAGVIAIIDRVTLALLSTKTIASIPSGSLYFRDGAITEVGSEIWVNSHNNTTGAIAVYSSDFTTLITTIVLPGALPELGSSWYRQGEYLDPANGKYWIGDSGSKKLFVIDTATRSIVSQHVFSLDWGKLSVIAQGSNDPVTGELYIAVQGYSSLGDATAQNKFYLVNRTTYAFEKLYADQSLSTLTSQAGTNVCWGAAPGLTQWTGNPSYSTDGKIQKFTR